MIEPKDDDIVISNESRNALSSIIPRKSLPYEANRLGRVVWERSEAKLL
jgi:hypothetical protein